MRKDKPQLAMLNFHVEMKHLSPTELLNIIQYACHRLGPSNMIALCDIIYECPCKMLTAVVIGLLTSPCPFFLFLFF